MKTQLRRNSLEARRAEAQEVIDILHRWDLRMNGHQTQKRSRNRFRCSTRICVFQGQRHGTGEPEKSGVTAWARNVSPKGVAFIYKGIIEWKRVLICLDPDSGEATWIQAEIVWSRNVHNDFWDYGARFLRRTTPEDELPPLESAVD